MAEVSVTVGCRTAPAMVTTAEPVRPDAVGRRGRRRDDHDVLGRAR